MKSAGHYCWKWRKLAELSRLETGHTPSRQKPEYWDGDIPWIGIRDATANHGRTLPDTNQHVTQEGIDNSSARILPANTVCLSRTASVGYVVVMGREMATSQDFVNWVCDESKLDYRFLKYVLLAENRSFSRFSHGTTHQTIYFPEVKAFHICVPSIEQQRAIADVLSALDDKIEQNRRTGRALEGLARATFKAWFVDFEPVKAKAAGQTSFPGLPPAAFAALPDRLTDSPIGPVPEGWAVVPVEQLIVDVYDGPHATPPEASDGAVFLGIKNLTGTQIDLSEVRRISESDWPRWTKRVTPRHGDIVFTYEATIGFFAMIPPGLRCCLGRRMALLRPIADVDPHYLFHYAISPPFQRLLAERTVHGSTVNRTSLSEFPKYPVLWATLPVREAFENLAKPIWSLIHSCQAESAKLAALRDYLLPRLLSGRVRAGDANGFIPRRTL